MIACPTCGSVTRVYETRKTGSTARRRRHCTSPQCSTRITTMELIIPNPTRQSGTNDFMIVRRAWLTQLQEIVGTLVAAPSVSDVSGDDEPQTQTTGTGT